MAATVAAAAGAVSHLGSAPGAGAPPPVVEQGSTSPVAAQVEAADIADALRARIFSRFDPVLGALSAADQRDLSALYGEVVPAPLWADAALRPTPVAHDALALLDGAGNDGLDPREYDAATLRRLAVGLELAPLSSPLGVADFDVSMSIAMLRFFRHLHQGRIDARTVGFRMIVPEDRHDLAALLRAAIAGGRIIEAAEELAPPLFQYRALRNMLVRYRALAGQTGFEPLPPGVGATR